MSQVIEENIISEAHFRIDGEWFTDFSRDFVAEGRWRHAIETITDCIIGTTMEQAIDILSGKCKFVGCSDDGWELEDETEETRQQVIDRQFYQYSRVVELNKGYYKIYAQVTNFGFPDLHIHTRASQYQHVTNPIELLAEQNMMTEEDLKDQSNQLERVLHYAQNDKDIAMKINGNYYLLESVVVDSPLWLKISNNVEEVLKRSTPIITGYLQRYYELDKQYKRLYEVECFRGVVLPEHFDNEIIQQQKYDDRISEYKKEILAQTTEWIDIVDPRAKRKNQNPPILATVPKAPFIRWCLSRSHGGRMHMPKWNNVCLSGMKLTGDNRDHTDWMVGGGLDLDKDYKHDSPIQSTAYTMMYDIQEKHCNFDVAVLCDGGMKTGPVRFLTLGVPVSDVNDGDILITTTAGPQFVPHINVATKSGFGGVLSMTGGKLCHLATVGREQGFTMMMDFEALSRYKDGDMITLDPELGTVFIRSYDTPSDIDNHRDTHTS